MKSQVLPLATQFYQFVSDLHPLANPIELFVNFALLVAETPGGKTSAQAIIDADIIPLLASFRYEGHGLDVAGFIQRFQQAAGSDELEFDDGGLPQLVEASPPRPTLIGRLRSGSRSYVSREEHH